MFGYRQSVSNFSEEKKHQGDKYIQWHYESILIQNPFQFYLRDYKPLLIRRNIIYKIAKFVQSS